MAPKSNTPSFHANTRKEWRKWLDKYSESEKFVWLIIYHKSSATKSVDYEEAVEEALCFGWIDSVRNKRDSESSYLYFAPRKPKGNWSTSNKERVARLIKDGLMTPRGQALIDLAKQTGTWDTLTDAQNAVIPDDLQKLFAKNKTAFKNFQAFSASSKRLILEWIATAKRPETRKQRIEQTVELAAKNIKANHLE